MNITPDSQKHRAQTPFRATGTVVFSEEDCRALIPMYYFHDSRRNRTALAIWRPGSINIIYKPGTFAVLFFSLGAAQALHFEKKLVSFARPGLVLLAFADTRDKVSTKGNLQDGKEDPSTDSIHRCYDET